MDIICPFCREPWEIDYLHEVQPDMHALSDADLASYKRDAMHNARILRKYGCRVFGNSGCPGRSQSPDPAIAMMYDLLGDDIDGLACMLEDMEMMDDLF